MKQNAGKGREKWLVIVVLCAGLTTCAADPRNAADAEATRIIALQGAADRQQYRDQDAVQFALQQAEREQASAQWVSSYKTFIRWSMGFATLAVCLALAGAGLGGGISLAGLGLAAARGANARADLVYLDRSSGQFPLVRYEGHGFVTLTDANTGMTLKLDTRNEGNRQLIATSGAVRLSGIVSHNAMLHKNDPAGVALVGTNPVTIFDADGSAEINHEN